MYTHIHAQICGGIRVAAQWLMYRQHSGSVDTISKDDNGRLNSRSFGEGPRCDSVRTHKALVITSQSQALGKLIGAPRRYWGLGHSPSNQSSLTSICFS